MTKATMVASVPERFRRYCLLVGCVAQDLQWVRLEVRVAKPDWIGKHLLIQAVRVVVSPRGAECCIVVRKVMVVRLFSHLCHMFGDGWLRLWWAWSLWLWGRRPFEKDGSVNDGNPVDNYGPLEDHHPLRGLRWGKQHCARRR